MGFPLLEGNVDTRDEDIRQLEVEVGDLNHRLAEAQRELLLARKENARAVAALRRQLSPLKQALDMVFGEIEAIGGEESPSAQSDNAKWDAIKQRVTPRMREAIDILLVQKSMKRTQLAAAMRMDYSNCNKNVIGLLLRQGLLIDNGQGLSLKQL